MKHTVHTRLEKCVARRRDVVKKTKEYIFENMTEVSQEFNVKFPNMLLELNEQDFIEWIFENRQTFLSQKHNDIEHIEFVYLVEDLLVSDNNVRIAETIESLCI